MLVFGKHEHVVLFTVTLLIVVEMRDRVDPRVLDTSL